MDQFIIHLLHVAVWVFFVGVILAIIGLFTVIRWIVGLFAAGSRAVKSGVENVERRL